MADDTASVDRSGLHHHGLGDRERKRNENGEGRSRAAGAGDVDAPVDRRNLGAHDVHADAASGKRGHRPGGRQAGQEYKLILLELAQLLVRGKQAFFDRLAAQLLQIEAGAVVGEDDHDLVRLLAQLDRDARGLRLSGRAARLRILHAMYHRVAQHMLQRRGDAFEHAAVEFDLRALDLELRLAAGFARRLPHDAVQAFAQGRERHRAHAHQVLLQFAADARLLQQSGVGFVHVLQQRHLDRGGIA